MNRKELERRITAILAQAHNQNTHGLPVVHKIMLTVDLYKNNKTDIEIEETAQNILNDSPTWVNLMYRNGWNSDTLYSECVQFLETNYKNGGDYDNIRKHFINYMNKKQQHKTKVSKTENASRW